MTRMHDVEFEIFGDSMQYVEVELDPQEAAIAEAGTLMYMDDGVDMETIFGDGAQKSGGVFDAILGAGKRILTGESLFMTVFSNGDGRRRRVAFAAPYPGKILAIDLSDVGGEVILQKDSFLCGAKGVQLDIALNRRLGAGLFGGEGFILQRLRGDGLVFIQAGGTLMRRTLEAGETLRVDTGCLVGFQPTVNYDIQRVKGIKSMLFGGEGLFFATLRGPGEIWLQSLPFSRLADRVLMAAPRAGGRDKGEGSVLGKVGRILDGDSGF